MTDQEVQVIVLNSHGIGHFVYLEKLPKPGETMRAKKWEFSEDAGKGTNVAVALGKLGVKAALVCRVGDDDAGKKGAEWLREAGVDLTYYIASPEIQTSVGLVIMLDGGENIVIGSAKDSASATTEQDVRSAIDAFPRAKYFLTGLEIDGKLPFVGCRYAKQAGKVTMLNPSPLLEPLPTDLDYVDYLFYNEVEGRQLLGLPDDCKDYGMIARQVVERFGVGTSVMTLGRSGCYVYGNGTDAHFSPFEMPRVATVGAGDGFMAAYAAGLVWRMDDAAAAAWANRYAGVVVSRPGSIYSYPWFCEVEKYLSTQQA